MHDIVSITRALDFAPRKRLQVAHAPRKSERAKMLKIADKTSNQRSMKSSPPKHWDEQRRREYFEWARAVVAGCRGVSAFRMSTKR